MSSIISDNLSAAGQNIRKYYQRRLPSNPDLDYYYVLRDIPNNETIIVEYGFADSNGETYTVKSSDTLYAIARKFNTTIDQLKAMNNLTSNLLSIGQHLKIPTSTATNQVYEVQRGDII